jgi:hypothetical protein
MSTLHIATAAVVKVSIGSPTGNRVAQFVQRGGIVPDGVAEDQLERLIARGLIEVLEVEPEEVDEGRYQGISVKDLKAEIALRNEKREDNAKLVPDEPGNRPELVAALLADDK